MSVRVGSGLSTNPDQRTGAVEAARAAAAGIRGEAADLVVVFASGAHLAAPEATLEAVHEIIDARELIGCGAGGVLGGTREVEGGTGVSVWAAAFDTGTATGFHAHVEDERTVTGMLELEGASGAILLADPLTFPTEAVLTVLSDQAHGLPVIGGLASARVDESTAALFLGRDVLDGGAVGVRLDGVALVPCVSQGAAPLGPELTITAAEGNLILELAGRPALEKLREVLGDLDEAEAEMLQESGGLMIGIVVQGNKPEYVQGDFLVRGVLGADPNQGVVAVQAMVRPGQVIRLHARDAASADRDLRRALAERLAGLPGGPAGALVFSCNGRGRGMFGVPDHDAEAVADALQGAPSAGFFAAGEIGPVGGEHFLHSFTATIGVFGAAER